MGWQLQIIESMQNNLSNIVTSTTSNEPRTANRHTVALSYKGKRIGAKYY